jgi:alginate O-acetyltransferase complex protein AlgI
VGLRFLSLIIISSALDYACGIGLGNSDDQRKRKLILAESLAANLGILGAFKYMGFFAESLETLFRAAGLKAHWPTLNITLPVGINF